MSTNKNEMPEIDKSLRKEVNPAEVWFNSFEQKLRELGINTEDPFALSNILVEQERPFEEYIGYMDPAFNDLNSPQGREFVQKFDQLKNRSTYAFMPVNEDGSYRVDRPAEGSTIPWLMEEMRTFRNASPELKSYLYQKAQQGKLYLRENARGYDHISDFCEIQVRDGAANITPGIKKMLKYIDEHDERHGINPAEHGISEQELQHMLEVGQRRGKYPKLKGIALGALTMLRMDEHSMNDVKKFLGSDAEFIEKHVAYYCIKHPDWVRNPKTLEDIRDYWSKSMIPLQHATEKELAERKKKFEFDEQAEVLTEYLLKATGCRSFEELVASKAVRREDGKPFSEDTRLFLRECTKIMRSGNPVLVQYKDGRVEKNLLVEDTGLSKAARKEVFENSLKAISELNKKLPARRDEEQDFWTMGNSLQILCEEAAGMSRSEYVSVDTMKGFIQRINDILPIAERNENRQNLTKEQTSLIRVVKETAKIKELITRESRGYREKTAESKANELKPESLNRYRRDLNHLTEMMEKTDSRFSNDSREYRELRTALQLTKTYLNDGRTVTNTIMENRMKYIADCCRDYMNTHKSIAELSSRQMNRLAVMNRILDLHENIRAGEVNPNRYWERNVAEKLVISTAIENQKKAKDYIHDMKLQSSALAGRRALLDHSEMEKQVEEMQKTPLFKTFIAGKEPNDLLALSTKEIADQYGKMQRASELVKQTNTGPSR